jgi:hypothetical protein
MRGCTTSRPGFAVRILREFHQFGSVCAPAELLSVAPNGHIEKLNSKQFYGQLQAFAKALHGIDKMSDEMLKGAMPHDV